jgi:hypothetical protein
MEENKELKAELLKVRTQDIDVKIKEIDDENQQLKRRNG